VVVVSLALSTLGGSQPRCGRFCGLGLPPVRVPSPLPQQCVKLTSLIIRPPKAIPIEVSLSQRQSVIECVRARMCCRVCCRARLTAARRRGASVRHGERPGGAREGWRCVFRAGCAQRRARHDVQRAAKVGRSPALSLGRWLAGWRLRSSALWRSDALAL
jgi:hypothetical protein